MSNYQKYSLEELNKRIQDELLKENMPQKLYQSTNAISRMINAIVKTRGDNWASQVVDKNGTPLLTKEEQIKFTDAFKPYIDTILDTFGPRGFDGGAYKADISPNGGAYKPDMSALSGMSSDFLKTKAAQATHSFPIPAFDPTRMPGIDDIYAKIVDRVGNVNSTVNDYASKYGILKLEKEHDLEPDIRVVPEPAALAVSQGLFALSTAAGVPIPPNITLEILSKIKMPFRTIVFTVYLILDVARLAIGITGPAISRKIMSLLLALLELLKGDWKKAVLTALGYFGMMPMLFGELLKVFLTLFRMLAPQIQHSIIFGSLDAAKSFVVGLLLAIFQVSAPEQVRLPLIGVLEKIAQHKAKMDGTLEGIGLSARPDYLAPTWNDLNNIQAVMSDEAYICSCEFEQLVKAVNDAPIISIILQILRIPVNQDMILYKCGNKKCEDFVIGVVKEAKDDEEEKAEVKAPFSMKDLKVPVDLNPLTSLTAPIEKAKETLNNATTKASNTAATALTGALTGALLGNKNKNNKNKNANQNDPTTGPKEETKEETKGENENPAPQTPPNNKLVKKGGRILHSRRNKSIS
jgi:hypothetical protein